MKTEKRDPLILSNNIFPVVGIGASAGGLNAFKKLLAAIPEHAGMAYVLVQHLDPNHESLLPALLQKVTRIPVLEISDDIKVLPDHIYIIPSNKMLVANDGVLQLSQRPEKNKNERNLPIDLFFASLAEVHQSQAIGVILSGTGTDGTKGLKAIKDYGGITFAQDGASAAYEEMPQSAVQAGIVDFILAPEEIPAKLLEIKQRIDRGETEILNLPATEKDIFKKILSLLRMRKGTDFTYYKQPTIRRRIFRRMLLNKNDAVVDYLSYLRKNKIEQDALYQDLLIPVTAFFRDHKVFDHLCESVFPQLIKNKKAGEPIRVWVTACSTGEEAYSVAICLREFMGDNPEKAQVFATDISEPAIAKARAGIYKKGEVDGLSAHRMQEFFIKTGDNYHVIKEIREMCVFAVHNFLKDPPFGKIDLVSCRNVLIYMEPYLQKKALTTFHYALQPKGFLLLGRSETTAGVPDLFAIEDKNDKLFSRKDVPGRFMHVASPRNEQVLQGLATDAPTENAYNDFQKTADEIMLRKYTPAGVVVNEMMDIVHFRGNTGTYLEQAPGKPSHNLLKMARTGLSFELRNLLYKVKKDNKPLFKDNIALQLDGNIRMITIEAIPLPNIIEPHYLVLFHDTVNVEKTKHQKTGAARSKKNEYLSRIDQLEKELMQAREDMRSITEEQEAANEELQSANEELLSGSEELQSLNEELETSKEELQSTNEELTSLNDEVNAARHYAESIIATLREPVLVLDKTLRVKTANDSFYRNFQVAEKETEGVLIYDLGNRQWNIPQLRTLLEEILPQKTEITDFEVTHTFPLIGERVILLNVKEIIREKTEEKLILLAIEDITERKHQQLKETEAQNRIIELQHEHGKELEEKVKSRTLELSDLNELLFQKNDSLKKMNAELESLTFISSHDLQEPLRKIQTFADRILEKDFAMLSDMGKDYFTRIHSSARHMQTLLEDVLAYAHTSILDRKFEVLPLSQIIQEVQVELSERIAQTKAVVITTGGLCNIYINHSQFRQVMNNLIMNAMKFSKPGIAPQITIKSMLTSSVTIQEQNPAVGNGRSLPIKNYCHITISDNGIGFDPQYEHKIFEVFQRLHGKEEYTGTGIGLAIVKKIIDNHKGFITATGETGKGARFDIYIPAT